MTGIARGTLLSCVLIFGGCAHVGVPPASEPPAETQSTGKNPVIVAMPAPPARDPEVVIHEYGQDIRTNIWLGIVFGILLFMTK